jgi:SAM-dependent methyltransferase
VARIVVDSRVRDMTVAAVALSWTPELARAFQPTTGRLLQAAGIDAGMTVLDVHTGTGDVAFQIADLVGPSGRVVGIDTRDEAVRSARCRATGRGVHVVEFRHTDLGDPALPPSFDAVVFRHALLGQQDASAFLTAAAARVRPGGVLAMHEMDMSRGVRSCPPLPALREVNQTMQDALERSGVLPDAGGRLVDLIDEAGLPTAHLFSESIVGSSEDPTVFALVASMVRALTPLLTAEEIAAVDVGNLETGLRRTAARLRSQVEFIPQVCAWTRL